jgi:hypothetical protein
VQDPVLRVLGFGACLDAALHLPPSPAVMPWPPGVFASFASFEVASEPALFVLRDSP